MDIASFVGFFTAFGLIVMALLQGGQIAAFFNAPSLLITVGGTIGATMIAYPLANFLASIKVVTNVFFVKSQAPNEIIQRIVSYAQQSRRDGVLALEGALESETDDFLRKGLMLVVDGQDVDSIQQILDTEIENIKKRHDGGAEFFTQMGIISPAFGLIGTLIGLVQMLGTMDDPSTIGPSMAVALLTTFYGAIMANAIFNPMAQKLRIRSGDEVLLKSLELQGIMQIAAGANPRIVEQQLHAYLAPASRESQFD
ncbi:MAG TPA: motility protein A [Myxococcales bacterium]|nr:motility protein A [Myxococcales bacterium]